MVRVGLPDMPVHKYGKFPAVFGKMPPTPAMSKCAHGTSSGTKAERKAAAVAEPAGAPPVLFSSALCVGDIASVRMRWLTSGARWCNGALTEIVLVVRHSPSAVSGRLPRLFNQPPEVIVLAKDARAAVAQSNHHRARQSR